MPFDKAMEPYCVSYFSLYKGISKWHAQKKEILSIFFTVAVMNLINEKSNSWFFIKFLFDLHDSKIALYHQSEG